MRVLVLEDDDDLRECMPTFLSTIADVECVLAGSVEQLQEKADDALRTDLALLDINLGRGLPSGVDAFDWLMNRGYAGRVVFTTGHAARDPLVAQALRLGRAIVLSKPIPRAKLSELMHAEGT